MSNRRSLTRRQALRAFSLVAAGLALSACAQQSASQPPGPAATSAVAGQTAPAAKVSGATVKFGVLSNYKGDALEQAMPEFEKSSGVKVALDKLPAANLSDKLAISFASGNPDYDVAMMDEPWVAGLSSYLVNLDELVKRDDFDLKPFVPKALAAGEYQNQHVAMPLDPNVMMLWYRKDLFGPKSLNAPNSLGEMIDDAQKLNDPASNIAGISVAAKKDAQLATTSIVLLWNNGQEIITQDGKFGFDSPAGVKALNTYKDLLNYAPKGVLGYGPTEQLDAFYNGQAAMVFYWASIGPNATNPDKSKGAANVGWVGVPNGMRGVWTLGIPQGSKQRDAAWELIKWLTTPAGSQLWTKYGGGHSARYDVLQSPDFQKTYPWAPDLVKALENSRNRPQTPNWLAMETIIVDMATAALSGQKSTEDAIKSANEQMAQYLKQ
jgi:multiple sugar transport system substrate-binding protein